MSEQAEQSGAPVRVWLEPDIADGGWAIAHEDACPGDVEFVNASVVRGLVEALEAIMETLPSEEEMSEWHPLWTAKLIFTADDIRPLRAALARIRGGTET